MTEAPEEMAMAAEAALERGDMPAAKTLYTQALTGYRQTGAYLGRLVSLMGLAETHRRVGDLAQAIAYHEEALVLAQERSDSMSEGQIMLRLGALHTALDNPTVAIAYLDGALPFVVPPDPAKAAATTLRTAYDLLTTLAELLAAHNRPHDAIAHYRHALVFAYQLDDGQRAIFVLDKLAALLDNIGNSADARKAADARAALERLRTRQ